MTALAITLIVVVALLFDYTNGFHDAANAIATSVSTRALTPRVALAMAAVLNLVGAFVATGVAGTVGKGIISAPQGSHGLVLVFSALLGAITWNLITWYFGLPSSSSHALIGGLVGSAIVSGQHWRAVHWRGVVEKVVVPMVISPIIGGVIAFVLMLVILWVFQRNNPHRLNRGFRHLQTLSAAAMSYSHGTQDAQKTMGVITLALVTGGYLHTFVVPWWVKVAAAAAMALGTYSGGWRIMRTLGRRIIQLDPPRGFAAESTSSAVLLTAAHFGAPVSTTHVITSAVMGVGATKRFSAVRWGVAWNIVVAWVLTIPAAALVAAAVHAVLLPFFG
ncbi:MAG TPA: inorganic phosphate transporter [Acidothermaceae bacterium]|jgi:PiT family inorganic phosphate transporter